MSKEEIILLQEKDYCKKYFDIQYPLLLKTNSEEKETHYYIIIKKSFVLMVKVIGYVVNGLKRKQTTIDHIWKNGYLNTISNRINEMLKVFLFKGSVFFVGFSDYIIRHTKKGSLIKVLITIFLYYRYNAILPNPCYT